ncbi:MAG: transporter substrate-binding domain-containing protein [Colwellia sp.]
MKCFAFLFLFIISLNCYAVTIVRVVDKQKLNDASHDYFTQLLRLALAKTSTEYGKATLKITTHPGQERVIHLLSTGDFYDIAWSGSSKEREKDLLKIQYPLFKGGLGWRGLVIKKENINTFQNITNLSALKKKVACQGLYWPDAKILESNGLTVYQATNVDAMYKMVVLGRCDYFPLSIFEGDAELSAVKENYPELIFYQDLIIQYPLTMNFFVHKENSELAERLELGLLKLNNSGEFLNYMKKHSLTKNAFPLTQYKNAQVIKISNPNNSSTALTKFGLQWPK